MQFNYFVFCIVIMFVSMCAIEREKGERERESVCVCVFVCKSVWVCVYSVATKRSIGKSLAMG